MAGQIIDFARLEESIEQLRERFQGASPFPSIAVDNALCLAPADVDAFPDITWPYWNKLGDAYQLKKVSCSEIEAIPEPFAQIIREASTPRFLRILEELTGIKKLIPDPYLSGGGLHLSGPGGILAPHTDFHVYRSLDLYRQINVLFYLNEGWDESDGGCLTLYDGKDCPQATIVPAFGRMVAFTTNDKSVHGFPTPVAEGKWRKSIALYYYSAKESDEFAGDETTYWRQHAETNDLVRRARFAVYRGLLNLSRLISIAAHVVNPHQGLGLVKTVLGNRARERQRRAL